MPDGVISQLVVTLLEIASMAFRIWPVVCLNGLARYINLTLMIQMMGARIHLLMAIESSVGVMHSIYGKIFVLLIALADCPVVGIITWVFVAYLGNRPKNHYY